MKFLFQLAAGFSAVVAVVSIINAGTAFVLERDLLQPLGVAGAGALCGFLLMVAAEVCKSKPHR